MRFPSILIVRASWLGNRLQISTFSLHILCVVMSLLFMAFTKVISTFLLLQIAQFSPASCEWIDMSHFYDKRTFNWGITTPYQHTLVYEGELTGEPRYINGTIVFKDELNKTVPYFLVYDIKLSEHAGTHLDAPVHFAKGKWTVDEIPLDRLVGQAIVVNISDKASKDRNAQLSIDDLQKWEKKHGRIPDDCILFVLTGWGKYWGNTEQYCGTADSKNSTLYEFPGINPKVAEWLVENRKIKGIGIDTASIDTGRSAIYLTHQILYKENIYGLENVANVDKLPPKGATIYVMPMNIKGGSGAPARIFFDSQAVGRSCKHPANVVMFLVFVLVALRLI